MRFAQLIIRILVSDIIVKCNDKHRDLKTALERNIIVRLIGFLHYTRLLIELVLRHVHPII